ncbi:uncharacterized protein LOC116711742 [Xiphophorus hellerii]|uniref:uncharacterized protein LOC116711742 n=1 Tax=Xiphophorus hellerii TaxID=8084 RepID=UPI0013B46565|nr:uncharacterized protein LOC116711742 [Xiphophorus hellerii]
MPYPLIFPIGFGLGYLVTTGMKKLFDHYLPGTDLDQSASQDESTSFGNKLSTVPQASQKVDCEASALDWTKTSSLVATQDVSSVSGNNLPVVPKEKTDPAGKVCSVKKKVDCEASALDWTKTSSLVATQDVSSVFGNNLPVVPKEKTDPAGKVFSGTEFTEKPLISSISSLALSEMKSLDGRFSSASDLKSSSDEEFISEGRRVYNENRVLDLSMNSLLKRRVSVDSELSCTPDGEAGLTDRNSTETPANDGSFTFPKDKTTPDGVVVSQDERKVFGNHYCTVPQDQTDPDGKVIHEEQSRIRRTEGDICRFANRFNNSWMSACFQSVLNLSVTRRCLAQRHPFKEASSTPYSASLIHTAIHQPGKYFSPAEISPVLMELKEREPSPELGKQFEISCLLESILVWLDSYGGSTDREMYCENTCTGCGTSFSELLNNGPLVVLPSSTSLNDTASLFNNWINLWGQPHCSTCRSGLNRKNVLSNNNVIVLFLPRWSKRRYPVIPNPIIEVPGKSGTELYSLSSVICGDAESAHFYSYLIRGQQTVKVVDEDVLTAGTPCREDMYERGFLYVYEKQTNAEEPDTDHLNTPSLTDSPAPPLQNHEDCSGEEPELLNLKEENSAEDKTSGHFEGEEMRVSQIEDWGPEIYSRIDEETFWEDLMPMFLFLFSLCCVIFPGLVFYWAGYSTMFCLTIAFFGLRVSILGF